MPIRGNLITGLATPTTLEARLTVDRGLVTRQIRGEKVGAVSNLVLLTSERTLSTLLLQGAQQFIRDKSLQGFKALQDPSEFIVWGPYQSRVFGRSSAQPTIAHLSAEGEDKFPESADFVIKGPFLATHGRIPT